MRVELVPTFWQTGHHVPKFDKSAQRTKIDNGQKILPLVGIHPQTGTHSDRAGWLCASPWLRVAAGVQSGLRCGLHHGYRDFECGLSESRAVKYNSTHFLFSFSSPFTRISSNRYSNSALCMSMRIQNIIRMFYTNLMAQRSTPSTTQRGRGSTG